MCVKIGWEVELGARNFIVSGGLRASRSLLHIWILGYHFITHLIWSTCGLLHTRTLSLSAHSHHVYPKSTITQLCYNIISSLTLWKIVFWVDLFPSFPTGKNRSVLLVTRSSGGKKDRPLWSQPAIIIKSALKWNLTTPWMKLHLVTAGSS